MPKPKERPVPAEAERPPEVVEPAPEAALDKLQEHTREVILDEPPQARTITLDEPPQERTITLDEPPVPQAKPPKKPQPRRIKWIAGLAAVLVVAVVLLLFVGNRNDGPSISAGGAHTVALKKDGTVVATGRNNVGQCNVSSWTDIVAVAAGSDHTVGLKKDGTVVAVGSNANGQCSVRGWRDIVAVAAGGRHTVGLKKDGTVVAVGWNEYGQCYVSDWKNIRLPK